MKVLHKIIYSNSNATNANALFINTSFFVIKSRRLSGN